MPEATTSLPQCYLDNLTVRAVEGEENTFDFTAATEHGVMTMWGNEYLRMSGVSLTRFQKNPVILDAHNRDSARAVVGRGDVNVAGREMSVRITFASTERAQDIRTLVAEKMIRAVSVGFIPLDVKELSDGEHDGDGAARIAGPAVVIKKWDLFEISVVPVPADADAIRRSLQDCMTEYGLRPNPDPGKECDMQLFEKWLEKRGLKSVELSEERRKELEAECERELFAEAETAPPVPETLAPTFAEQVRAIAPRVLKSEDVDQIVLETDGKIDEAKKRMLAMLTARAAPVGTPEPEEPPTPEQKEEEAKAQERAFDSAVAFMQS